MNKEEQQEYQEKMGSPEMEYLQYLSESPQCEHPVDGDHVCELCNI